MGKLQWDTFVKKIYIKATIPDLYKLWATKKGITSWFLRDALYTTLRGDKRKPEEYIEKGDLYSWYWHNWDGKEAGTVIEANGKDYIKISFAKSTVTIKFEHKNNATLIILTQFEIPDDEENKMNIFYGCSNGWTFWLANLKAFVEHEILLNETDINLQEHELSCYEFVNM